MDAVTSSVLCIYIVLYCIVFSMYWRAPRLALVATWVIQSLQNKYVYIIYQQNTSSNAFRQCELKSQKNVFNS